MKELEKGLEKSFKPLKELKNYAHAEVDPRKQGLKPKISVRRRTEKKTRRGRSKKTRIETLLPAEMLLFPLMGLVTQRSIQENKD